MFALQIYLITQFLEPLIYFKNSDLEQQGSLFGLNIVI